ncbi:MAG: SDR family oxidoreductase [Dissulfurispiraceae bacterium]|jgi:dTDP-4-dehydrorhamnose reductase|nr:SDR family oxidoreductase [Dissulfurispiraceae bacterium]
MDSNVLITGGSGLLALNWAVEIRRRVNVYLALHKRRISIEGVKTCFINLESFDLLIDSFKLINPQLVIHTAGFTNVDDCEKFPDIAKLTNVDITKNVAKVCNYLNIPLVHISTDHLFSGENEFTDESVKPEPLNVYAKTKAEAEAMVLKNHSDALVIRTNFFCWGTHYRESFSDIIINALRSDSDITLFEDVYFTPILVRSLVRAVHDLVDTKAIGIYNVVGDERLSKYEFGLKIAKVFGLNPDYIKAGFMAEHKYLTTRPYDMSLSNRKTCVTLGRKLGGVEEQIVKLKQQEREGLAMELKRI